jgi:hypothetical protein
MIINKYACDLFLTQLLCINRVSINFKRVKSDFEDIKIKIDFNVFGGSQLEWILPRIKSNS